MTQLNKEEVYRTFERNDSNSFESLGRATWLWMASDIHSAWTLNVARDALIPPITLGQYLILERDGLPAGYASWAYMSLEAEIRYIQNPSKIKLEDWKSGDRIWFIDWLTPFSKKDTIQLKKEIDARYPDNIARSLRIRPESDAARVYEFHGANVPRGDAKKTLDELQRTMMEAIQKVGATISPIRTENEDPD